MVQRKAPNKKLGIIQADGHHHVKSEKRLANLKAITSYQHHHQDYGKNRGPEMKKKVMKKSRSVKLSDVESLRSSSSSSSTTLKKAISQHGKPPPPQPPPPSPLDVPAAMPATPQKQQQLAVMRTTPDGSPNYMKSTSSSKAKKESSQVSSRNTQIDSDSKNMKRRNSSDSKASSSSSSSSKPARSLTRSSSSLKRVRTLTKTPSFKHVRSAPKKCSRVVDFCADVNAQRATCSSTQKDTKFPSYLTLSPGATEAEGTSAMHVCPYTYCSLNGHHHKPLPPLKRFLSARRRMLKTQKNMKLESLSPRRFKPVGEQTDAGQAIFADKPAYMEEDFIGSPRSPLIKEGSLDFFIEIYAQKNEGKADQSPLGGCDGTEVEHNNYKQVAESLSDGSPHSEIDNEENLEKYCDIFSMGVDVPKGFPEEQRVEDPDRDYLPVMAENEAVSEGFYSGSDFEEDCSASIEGNDSISEVMDMEWEEGGQFTSLQSDTEANDSVKNDNGSDLDDGYLSEIDNNDLYAENIVTDHKEILADEDLQQETTSFFDTQGKDCDSEMDDRNQNLEIIGVGQVSDSSSHDQQLSTEDAEKDLTGVEVASAIVEPTVEPTASSEEIQEEKRVPEAEVEMYYNLEVTDETLGLQNQNSDAFHNLGEINQAATKEVYNGIQEHANAETDKIVAINNFDVEQQVSNSEAGVQTEDKEQVAVTKRSIGVQFPEIEDEELVVVTKISVGIQVPDFSHSFYEENQDDAEEDVGQHQEITTVPCKLEEFAEDSNSSEDIAVKTISDENQELPSDDQNGNFIVADDQNFLKKDEDEKFKIQSSMDSEEQNDASKYKISLAETDAGEIEEMEGEEKSQPDTAARCPTTSSTSLPEPKGTLFLVESKSSPEMPVTSSNQKWKIGSKRTINDEEELRNFNPRDPNFLPEVPDPDPEKVDLKHQMMDERKNSEEWMVDYALRKTVTKLGPARKKKVALLVEAFETVLPVPRFDTRLRHSSASFGPARPMQACS